MNDDLSPLSADAIDFEKAGGLVPAIVQHERTGEVLMLGYMNAEALEATQEKKLVTFWSRSKNRLWTKGETSGDVLRLVSIAADCDRDALLVQALPEGPTCHLGTRSCFGDYPGPALAFIGELSAIVDKRGESSPEESYTARLLARGINKIAQKVGEEGVETALAGVSEDNSALTGEAADLIFHLIVLLKARGLSLGDVAQELKRRHEKP
ncbi:histidine biosynthesis bifunctional protein HisIE [Glycocaulis albus]|uniref:Histidine biosynthesis bifunctional protein HisIE n=1 Tax=Glycocaulis albus TaxID=1382801 RepID=A0ABQ1XSI2_9PROT|nr:bifunctional phosphoribosyl-AMP cyclohydrolase/phosphoribosyl-ATP diphosphatase HisIE [Glycocaulis albus]MBV5257943.1 bifunctional phosphoribosyl-AMP cyclohydrolase/phosphoribosyl-ATP diphosphatase HisIE [Synechococcus moorigangaii CMS01]GGH02185.1 histidine biosynthesis bifunctional protein HisIE [Glycocaulis albus]